MKYCERIYLIKKYCKGKKVLDIGSVESNFNSVNENPLWLHKHIKSVSKSVLGLDYSKKDVDMLNSFGFNMIHANAENFNLNKKFEVIVAGEIIEHLGNPGNFINSVKSHMNKDTIFIITTPNVFSIRRLIGSLLKIFLKEQKDHVAYYSNSMIRGLLNRYDLRIVDIKYLYSEDKNKIRLILEKFLGLFFRKSNRSTLFIVAKLKK